MINIKKLTLLYFLSCSFIFVRAEEKKVEDVSHAPIPKVTADIFFQESVEFNDGQDSKFEMSEYRLNVPFYAFKFTDNIFVGAKLDYRFHDFSIGREGDLDLSKVSIQLESFYRGDNSKWLYWGSISPGFAFEGDGIDFDSFIISALAGAGYEFTENFMVVAGVYAGPSFGEYGIYPAIGIKWEFVDNWTLNLFPPSPNITWKSSDRLALFLMASPGGGSWDLPDDRELSYRVVRAGLGFEYHLNNKLKLTGWSGVNFFQKLKFEGGSKTPVSYNFKDAFFAAIGIRYTL